MSYLEIALANARKGYPQFPAQPGSKRPKAGFDSWEQNATTDEDTIRSWWDERDDWLPAIPPGRVGLAVIDVDQHEGKDNGFDSLEKYKVFLPDTPAFPSVSGNGMHHWYRGEVGSVNGVLPGVDRKAQGGYIVAVYELPEISEIVQPIPERLSGSVSSSVDRNRKSRMQLNEWIREVGGGDPDEVMWDVLDAYMPSGNEHMSKYIAKVVTLAARGHSGGSYVLDRMLERWLSVTHFSGEPEEEFMVNVRSAIEKFGDPVYQETLDDAFAHKLEEPTYPFNEEAKLNTISSLKMFCTRIRRGWEDTHNLAVIEILSSLSLEKESHTAQEYQEMYDRFEEKLRRVLNG